MEIINETLPPVSVDTETRATDGLRDLWIKIVNFFTIAFLAYASWYDAENFGQRFHFDKFPIKGLTEPGLINTLTIVVFVAVFFPHLFKSLSARRPDRLELLALFYPLMVVFNFRAFDREYLIGVENGIFLSVLVLALLRSSDLAPSFKSVKIFGPWAIMVSYILAVFLPLVIRRGDYDSVAVYGEMTRYVGWLGVATYIGFLGMTAAFCGALTVASKWPAAGQRYEEYKICWPRLLGLLAMIIGVAGIELAVHRTALVALTVGIATLTVQAFRRNSKSLGRFFGLFFLVLLALNVIPPMSTKSQFQIPHGSLDVIQTNGRILMFKILYHKTEGHRLFGLGTGGASHYILKLGHVFGGEPHDDYLRIFVDHGAFGLVVFLAIGIGLVWRLRKQFVLAIIMAFGVSLLPDNILVYPIYGYGPLLLLAFIFSQSLETLS